MDGLEQKLREEERKVKKKNFEIVWVMYEVGEV
jgi:hypothetical protein